MNGILWFAFLFFIVLPVLMVPLWIIESIFFTEEKKDLTPSIVEEDLTADEVQEAQEIWIR